MEADFLNATAQLHRRLDHDHSSESPVVLLDGKGIGGKPRNRLGVHVASFLGVVHRVWHEKQLLMQLYLVHEANDRMALFA
jgi:hypothetical protein